MANAHSLAGAFHFASAYFPGKGIRGPERAYCPERACSHERAERAPEMSLFPERGLDKASHPEQVPRKLHLLEHALYKASYSGEALDKANCFERAPEK